MKALRQKRLRSPKEEVIWPTDCLQAWATPILFRRSPACWSALQISDLPAPTTVCTNSLQSINLSLTQTHMHTYLYLLLVLFLQKTLNNTVSQSLKSCFVTIGDLKIRSFMSLNPFIHLKNISLRFKADLDLCPQNLGVGGGSVKKQLK